MTSIPSELELLARLFGVQTFYVDDQKRRRDVSAESVLAVLGSLGVEVPSLDAVPALLHAEEIARLERGVEPVTVLWDSDIAECPVTLPKSLAAGKLDYTIEFEGQSGQTSGTFPLESLSRLASPHEDFLTFRLPLPRVGPGYHQLALEAAGKTFRSLLISAPRQSYAGDATGAGEWGCFLPLYAIRSQRNWGAGDFTDLQHLMHWVTSLGGKVVGTLPLLAAFLDDPCEPSPYAPASRLAWNEFYVDVERVPEFRNHAGLREAAQSEAFAKEIASFREPDYVAYREIMALKRRWLEILADEFFREQPSVRFADFKRFLGSHPHLEDYAEFRAAHDRQHRAWSEWPEPMRHGSLKAGDYDLRNKQYHLYAQWTATTQLENLAEAAGGGLYLDLPLGVRQDGYDVWRWGELYANGSSAGAPPDIMWTKGQDWGFPPLHPTKIREQGYRHVRDYLKHHLRLARILRIDHVMQLHRLYWVPHGLPASRGAYVQYRPEEFYAILSLESHRSRTTLVGENLGTVPPEVNQAMDRHNMQRLYVVQYEIASEGEATGLKPVGPGALASLNTHDMPMFAAWWRGEDILLRQELGLIDEEETRREQHALRSMRESLTQWLRSENWLREPAADEQQIFLAILKFLSMSEAGVVLVNLEDLWGETRPQNIPGTGFERPNWRRKAALGVEEFRQSPEVLAGLQTLAQFRLAQKQTITE